MGVAVDGHLRVDPTFDMGIRPGFHVALGRVGGVILGHGGGTGQRGRGAGKRRSSGRGHQGSEAFHVYLLVCSIVRPEPGTAACLPSGARTGGREVWLPDITVS